MDLLRVLCGSSTGIPGPGAAGPFFLGGFQDSEDGAEGLGSREFGAHPAVAGEGGQEALELAHAHREVTHGVSQLVMVHRDDWRRLGGLQLVGGGSSRGSRWCVR